MSTIHRITLGLFGPSCAMFFLLLRNRPAHIMADEILQEMSPQQLEEFMRD